MKHLIKWLALILVIVILLSVIWLCWVWHRTEVLGQTFVRVQRGDSQARVVALFGQPRFITSDLQTNINWDEEWVDKTNGVRCIQQFHYCPPFTICGEEWVVGFDDHSNAVAKYHIVSP